jgi:tyrosine-protein kinase Etk/Wzc
MRALSQRVAELEVALAKELERNQEAFRLEKAYLMDQLNQLEASLPEYRRLVSDYDTYKRDFSLLSSGKVAWEQAYATLKQKLTAMDYTGQEPRVNFKFNGYLELRDELPVAPNKRKLLTYAMVLGLGLAFGAPFALDRLRFTTSIVAEAEKISGLQALGVVPHMIGLIRNRSCAGASSADFWPDKHVQEAFRMIRSQITVQVKPEKKVKVLMVVSCRASEGKSTIASFLAASFASAKIKTLLVDADLRRGRLGTRLGVPKGRPGLAELLHGLTRNPKEIIYNLMPNLDIAPRGSSELKMEDFLSDDKLLAVIDEWREEYEMIIVDTTPILGIADPLELRRSVDATLLVIRAESTTHRDMITVRDQLVRAEMDILGFVLNDVEMSKLENSYYYSTYYPRYYSGYYYNEDARAGIDSDKRPA